VWSMFPYYNCAAHMMLGPHEAASDFKRECKCMSSLLPQPPGSPGLSVHIGAKKVPLLWGVKESQVKKVLLRLWQRAPTRLASDN
jgi:hypothetical protein